MNFRIITKNHAAYSKLGFLQKSVSAPLGLTSLPNSLEVKVISLINACSCHVRFEFMISQKKSLISKAPDLPCAAVVHLLRL